MEQREFAPEKTAREIPRRLREPRSPRISIAVFAPKAQLGLGGVGLFRSLPPPPLRGRMHTQISVVQSIDETARGRRRPPGAPSV